jgi:hypothetical protein
MTRGDRSATVSAGTLSYAEAEQDSIGEYGGVLVSQSGNESGYGGRPIDCLKCVSHRDSDLEVAILEAEDQPRHRGTGRRPHAAQCHRGA